MKLKRISLLVGIFALLMLIAFSIFTVFSISEEQLREEMVQSIGNNEGRDTHLAVGRNILDGGFDYVLNNEESLQDIVLAHDATVINFFASWCLPCQREMPELNELYKEIKGTDVAVVAVNIDDKVSDRDDFLSEHNVEFPVFEFHDETVGGDQFKVQLIPTTFFVNSDGEIVRAYIGEVHLNLLNNYISYVKETY